MVRVKQALPEGGGVAAPCYKVEGVCFIYLGCSVRSRFDHVR